MKLRNFGGRGYPLLAAVAAMLLGGILWIALGPRRTPSPPGPPASAPGSQPIAAGDARSGPESPNPGSDAPPQPAAAPGPLDLESTGETLAALDSLVGSRVAVVVFLGTDCPIAQACLPKLREVQTRFAPQGVVFLAVYPHHHETLAEAQQHAEQAGLKYRVLRDRHQRLADRWGVARVPTVCVLDRSGRVAYQGSVVERIGAHRPAGGREHLALAIEEVLRGESPSLARTPVDGCLLDRSPAATEAVGQAELAPAG